MELTSRAIPAGSTIADKYIEKSCGGQNVTPDLSWSGAPANTKSFAVTCYDPDAPTGSGFWHWVAADIPPSVTSLPLGLPADSTMDGMRQWLNDYGFNGYGGPCPPPGAPHRYIFTVYALDVEKLEVPDEATNAFVRFNIMGHKIADATFTGMYGTSA